MSADVSKKLERALKQWWGDSINVNDLSGSLTAALARQGLEIATIKHGAKAERIEKPEGYIGPPLPPRYPSDRVG